MTDDQLLTRDNSLLSRPTIEPLATRQGMVVSPLAPPLTNLCRAGNCATGSAVGAYVEAGIAPATRRAYCANLDHFEAWGGDLQHVVADRNERRPLAR